MWRFLRSRSDRNLPTVDGQASCDYHEGKGQAYDFKNDWFSEHIPKFTQYLAPLRGTDCKLLEVGTHEGRSATWLLENVAVDNASRLTCVDRRPQPNLIDNLSASGRFGRVDLRIGLSRDVLRVLEPASFDFIYIDGYHGQIEVLEDAVLSFRLAKDGALICFDDYLWDDPKFHHRNDGTPKISIDAFTTIFKKKIEIIEYGYQVWIRKLSD